MAEIGYSERRRVWSLRLTVVTTAVMAAIGGAVRLVRPSQLSTASWLAIMVGLTIVLLVLSTVRLVAEIDGDDLVVRLVGIRLLNVHLDSLSSITAVHWREPSGLARWVMAGVMPPGGVRIAAPEGRHHFVASAEPDRLAELIRAHL